MNNNLSLWEEVRTAPPAALKAIEAGRLRGKSDINPVWRLKMLTEIFGICGIGWKYEITDKRLEPGANEEVAAFVDINLYIKNEGEWSAPIPGTGGSTFVAKEKAGLYVNDECFKMALTDAISVSCKALGFAADVYWDKDSTKYNRVKPDQSESEPNQAAPPPDALICALCAADITLAVKTLSTKKFGQALCFKCQQKGDRHESTTNHL